MTLLIILYINMLGKILLSRDVREIGTIVSTDMAKLILQTLWIHVIR